MKTLASLLLLSTGTVAFAQRGPEVPRNYPRVDGSYASVQRDGTIRRTLRLDRDGSAEIVTRFRDDRNSRGGRSRLSDRDVDRYGRLADLAARGGDARRIGRWTIRDRKVVLRFNDEDGGGRGRDEGRDRDRDRNWNDRTEVTLFWRGDDLVLSRDSELLGKDKIDFRRGDGGWGGNLPPRGPQGLGSVLYDRDSLRIDGIDLREGNEARLVVRAEGRRFEIPGETRRRGDEVTFRIPYSGRDGGEVRLTTRGSQVVEIHGSLAYDRHRIDFDKEGRRP